MMPTREELIEKVAVSLCEYENLNPYYLEPGDVLGIDGRNEKGEPCHYYWREKSEIAEAALQALVSSLPTCIDRVETELEDGEIIIQQLLGVRKVLDNYEQLLEMKK